MQLALLDYVVAKCFTNSLERHLPGMILGVT